MNETRYDNAARLVRKLGYAPELIAAVMADDESVVQHPHFGEVPRPTDSKVWSQHFREFALLLSHRKALGRFLDDEDSVWALILEDDVAIDPAHVGLFDDALQYTMAISSNSGFVYLGLCSPKCMGEMVHYRDITLQKCWGRCSHAYAVSKELAVGLISDVLNFGSNFSYDSERRYNIDMLYESYFSNADLLRKPVVVGRNIAISQHPDWCGILFQDRLQFDSYFDHK